MLGKESVFLNSVEGCVAFKLEVLFFQGEPGTPGRLGMPGLPGRAIAGPKVTNAKCYNNVSHHRLRQVIIAQMAKCQC